MEELWTEIDGRPMRARRSLETPSREAVSVVALPGLGLSGDYLLPLAAKLAPTLRTYVLDLPGAGGAPGPAGRLGTDHLAKVVERWLDANGLRSIVLFGNSYGSEVALETALRLGPRARGVVLGAPTPDPGARSFLRQLARLLLAAVRAQPRLLAIAIRDYRRTGARRLLQEARAALDEPIVERLRDLQTPALIVRGARDPVVPQAWAEEAARLARSELVVIPGAGHGAPYVRPAEVAAAIDQFTASIAFSSQADRCLAVQAPRKIAIRAMAKERTIDVWGERTPYAAGAEWPARVDEHVLEEPQRWVQSACVLCSNGCGMDIGVRDGRIVGVRGRVEDRVNHGRLGPKGLYGWQANNSPERLTHPLVRRDGELQKASWDEAMELIVARSRELLESMGPLSLGFYTSGQLFSEEYYVQAKVARAGLGTPHLDGNTRLCTATAEWALIESFGCDGDPGSYTDIDLCDTLFLVGHNVAETQTVLWMRMLDRLHGPDRPKLVVVDPRPTPAAREADVWLPIRSGTNVALLNAIQHELIANGRIDRGFVDQHTVGFDALEQRVAQYPPERAAEICGVSAEAIREAAQVIGTGERLVSTCLQGIYQSNQATAAAVQLNNVNLLRGMIGKPGCSVFQMNGQPTAENTRETGANGALPAYRNFENDAHVDELAALWNVDPLTIPHWAPPTHAMQILRFAEEGSIRFLWITATNPAVSLPELHRIRSILSQKRLFVVVSDAFLTETAQLADIVLPAALWGEKQGTYTNADRTVHLSDKAVAPPGEARSDFDMFLDYAQRMGFADKDGNPLLAFATPEEAFEEFGRISAGRPCDYSGLTYGKLRGSAGIQWPCNAENPDGCERLYTSHEFPTRAEYCESYGHDLISGAENEPDEYGAHDPEGRAFLKAAEYVPSPELPSDDYPLLLNTGRTVYQWHTRTKTGRTPELQEAAPEAWVELAPEDAERLGIDDGDLVAVESARGRVEAPARLTGIREGVVFVPFHYGYWDEAEGSEPNGRARAANELTITRWDPVSKQPIYKTAAVRVEKVADADGSARPPALTTQERIG